MSYHLNQSDSLAGKPNNEEPSIARSNALALTGAQSQREKKSILYTACGKKYALNQRDVRLHYEESMMKVI